MQTLNITASGVRNLGEAAEGAVSSWVLQTSGGGSYSITLRKKIVQGSQADASASTTYYTNFLTGVDVAAGTAIEGNGVWKVACDGCDLVLDITYTSGSCLIEYEPLLG